MDFGRAVTALARSSIVCAFAGEPAPSGEALGERGAEKAGAFVTLKERGSLRGCVGYPEPVLPLAEAITNAARHAAFDDRRFPKLDARELPEVEIEVSVLTPPEAVVDPTDIETGRDGLIIRRDGCSGLLLPQVAVEQGWDRERFLMETCRKAGLPADAWKEGAEIYRFRSEIYNESR